jgi:hypothetical protein
MGVGREHTWDVRAKTCLHDPESPGLDPFLGIKWDATSLNTITIFLLAVADSKRLADTPPVSHFNPGK